MIYSVMRTQAPARWAVVMVDETGEVVGEPVQEFNRADLAFAFIRYLNGADPVVFAYQGEPIPLT